MPRVHEIAKQLGKDSKEILEKSKELGIDAKSHMSGIDDKDASKLIGSFTKKSDGGKVGDTFKEAAKNMSGSEKTTTGEADIKASAGQTEESKIRQPRPEGMDKPKRPRPEGMDRPDRPDRPRPPRPEGADRPDRPRRPRPEGSDRPDRPDRPRPPRPEGSDRPDRPRPPRPEGASRPDRPDRPRPPRPEGADRQRVEELRRAPHRPYTGEVSERPQQPRQEGQGGQRYDGARRPYQGGQGSQGGQGGYAGGQGGQRQGGGFQKDGPQRPPFGQRQGSKPGGAPYKAGGAQGGATKLQQISKPESRTPRNENYKRDKLDKTKRVDDEPLRGAPKPGVKGTKQTLKPGQGRNKTMQKPPRPPKPKEEIIEITHALIPQNITVKNFAEAIGRNTSLIIKTLMKNGVMANLNQEIEFEVAQKIGEQLNVLIELEEEKDILEESFKEEPDDEKDLVERPPVVVVMGHVDHGKTSLLDAIRDSSVQTSEAGGITQHIGAYTTKINNRSMTFLDTPGHEAFTAMRMRGASITDIAILVVAADDGVMPQTIEAINHAKAAGVEIIVAINKIDKPSVNPDRVKQELTEYGILVEEWGGDTVCVHVSALKKTGLDKLLEMILLVADIKELKANPNKRAKGTVVEALLDKGRGPVATVLIQEGTLRVGDSIVAGSCHGKVRAMMDDKGRRVKKAGPSKPVEILGLSEAPMAGDALYAAETDKQARQITELLIAKDRVDMTRASVQKVSLDDLFNQIKAGNVKDLNIVIKADVQGSVEAVKQSLLRLSNEEVKIRVIHGGVGAVTESDVMLAAASNAIIIGFNVRPEATAKSVAEDQGVDLRLYRVIYNAIEDISAAIKGMLDPVYQEKVIGHAEIRQVFKASGVGSIGGSYVLDGKITRNAKVRIMRNSIVVFDGELDSLKRFKDDAKEVATGYECGLLFHKYNDIKEGDRVEAYIMEEIER